MDIIYNKYSALSDNKLRALLETTTSDRRAIIAEILKSRTEGAKTAKNEAPGATSRPAPLTLSELQTLAEDLRAKYRGAPCQVLIGADPTWVDGVVFSISIGRRAGTVFLSIHTVDNQRVIKAYNSKDLKLTGGATIGGNSEGKRNYLKADPETWDPERELEKAQSHVGCLVAIDMEGRGALSMARVVAVIPNKRNRSILLRLHVPTSPTGDPRKYKELHRAISDSMCFISDERTAEIHDKYISRVNIRKIHNNLDPDKRVQVCMENLKKARASLERAKAIVTLREEQLADAKNEVLKTL